MKQSRREITLNEKDALQDMLDAEKMLMTRYAAALTEGSSAGLRKKIFKLYGEHADTQFLVFEQMLARGYYETQPADEQAIGAIAERFSKAKKQIGQ